MHRHTHKTAATRNLAVIAGLLLLLCALPATAAFNHLDTGFPLDGPHRNLACESRHGRLYDMLLGSVSEGIIRKSRLPVLVVPPATGRT